MASLSDLFAGTPPTYGVTTVGGGRSPFYGGAKTFSDYLTGLIGQPVPSYGGKIDPGMSPTLAALGQMMQAYSRSPQPGVMGQAGGVLGRFMNPSFANPMGRVQMGFPQYFGGSPTNPFMGGQNPFGPPPQPGMQPMIPDESGQVPPMGGGPQFTPPWMQPTGGGPPPMGGLSVSPNVGSGPTVSPMQPTGPQSINGGGFMAPGGNIQNALEIANKQPAVDGSMSNPFSPPQGMRNVTGEPVPQPMGGMRNATPPPPPPRLRPGQMTRQQWIDAGMTPGPRRGERNLTNIKMPKKVGPQRKKKGIFER